LDSKYEPLFLKALEKDINQFIKDVRDSGPQAARSKLGSYAWSEEMMIIMNDLYRESAVMFGNASYRATGQMSKKAYDPYALNSSFIDEMLNFLMTYGFWIISFITQTTKKRLHLIVTSLLSEGKSREDIIDAIKNDDELKMLNSRSKTITRTEVMRSSNYGLYLAATKHPFEVDKMWVSRRDGRTRRIPKDFYDHWDMDGQTKTITEPFVSTDKFGRTIVADMPGDPKTPKGFTINCRCSVMFVPRLDANGNLIIKR
jgi:hypothetical protein